MTERDPAPPIRAVVGPRQAGPGERYQMLSIARQHLEQAGAPVTRVDVPHGSTDGDGAGTLRSALEPIVPALQSGSLFGEGTALLVVDAEQLLAAEAAVIADLIAAADPSIRVAFVSAGALPTVLGKAIREVGRVVTVRPMRESDASSWLSTASRQRNLRLTSEAAGALLQRFGSDLAGLAAALDQLGAEGDEVTGEMVADRFRNRPDEPMWHYADAVAAGDVGEALRRLADFLTHSHPLVLLAFMAGEIRRRCLAAAAPDQATFAEWIGGRADSYPVRKAWRQRSLSTTDDLRRAVGALARADAHLKTAPEAGHRVMLERLTVAWCRWLGRRARSAG